MIFTNYQKQLMEKFYDSNNNNRQEAVEDFSKKYYRFIYDECYYMDLDSECDILYEQGITPFMLNEYLLELEKEKEKIIISPAVAQFINDYCFNTGGTCNWEYDLIMQHSIEYMKEEDSSNIRPEATEILKYHPYEVAQMLIKGYRVEYPEIQEGDIVISKEKGSCDIRIVEGADHDTILLVNGEEDLSYELPKELNNFWNTWKIMCKKEDRKDF